jgi:uncharacterized protein
MKNRAPLLLAGLAALFPAFIGAQAPAGRPITIGGIDSIWSPALKEFRRFHVYTPPSYQPSTFAPRAYPVLYLLDGDMHFHSVSGLLQILGTGVNGTYVVPEMIVVAIPNTNRTRDLTPTNASMSPDGKPGPRNPSGGLNTFLEFISAELIPRVESTYRTEPYRILVGHSFGGIAAIHALYTRPKTFNAYVAIDPSLWWDRQMLLKQAPDIFAKPAPSDRVLYVAQANTKSLTDSTQDVHFNSITEFNRVVQARNKSGIRYAFKYYENDDHGSVPIIAEYDALRFIFDGYKANLRRLSDQPALVREHFNAVSAKLGYAVSPPERLVDLLGNLALQRDTANALALAQMNIDLYPKSAHAFASLSTVLLAKRDTPRAREAIQRALELAPGDQRIRDMAAKLGVKP